MGFGGNFVKLLITGKRKGKVTHIEKNFCRFSMAVLSWISMGVEKKYEWSRSSKLKSGLKHPFVIA
jgi:hypothetical protein